MSRSDLLILALLLHRRVLRPSLHSATPRLSRRGAILRLDDLAVTMFMLVIMLVLVAVVVVASRTVLVFVTVR